jgi:CubicO group peptidase (beta-lactamase class C family)
MRSSIRILILFFAALSAVLAVNARAQLPVSGRPVPGMSAFDNLMTNFMNANGITAGVLGISRNGRIEYLRSFGWLREPSGSFVGVALPENAMMRTASVVKPVTAAAIRQFDAAGGFGAGGLNTRAFNGLIIGQSGLLNVTPRPALGDGRHADVTINHLLLHQGGYNRNVDPPGDVMFKSRAIAAALRTNSPPTNGETMSYMLGQSLQWAPGTVSNISPANVSNGNVAFSSNASPTLITTTAPHAIAVGDPVTITGHSVASVNTTAIVASVPSNTTFTLQGVNSTGGAGGTWSKNTDAYSNFGYMVLGELLQTFAPGGYLGYVQSHVMSPALWIPSTEFALARSLAPDRHPREPRYIASNNGESVFDNDPPIDVVPVPDGGFFIEAMLAHGGVIASAQAMIHFANAYHLWYTNGDIGQPITAASPMQNYAHSGRLDGVDTFLQQRSDSVVFYLAINRTDFGNPGLAPTLAAQINNQLSAPAGFTWPDATSDGFWVTLGAENAAAGFGGYHSSYQGFQSALDRVTDGSYLRLHPGSQAWTGTINKQVRLDAPEGPVTLGRQ